MEPFPKDERVLRMNERISEAQITDKADFWRLVTDLSVDYPEHTTSQIAERLLSKTADLPTDVLNEIDSERIEVNKYNLVVQYLNQMSLPDESEYRRMLLHLSESRNLSEDLVRGAILQECRIDHDLRELIAKEGAATPRAFFSNLAGREIETQNQTVAQEPEQKRGGVITSDVIGELIRRLDGQSYVRELEALERISSAVLEARNLYEEEVDSINGERNEFVVKVISLMDDLNLSDHSDLADRIAVAVSTEIEKNRDESYLRSMKYDNEDEILNMAARYIAIALYRKMIADKKD